MSAARLVFVPFPITSHLVAAVKTAKLLTDRDERLSVTVLVMKLPINASIAPHTKNPPNSRIEFVELPVKEPGHAAPAASQEAFFLRFIEAQKGPVRDAVAGLAAGRKPGRLAGFVLDLFCTSMIDVANEFNTPSYVIFTSGAAVLGLTFHLQSLRDGDGRDGILTLPKTDGIPTNYEDSDAVISIPTYATPVPAKVLPSVLFEKDGAFLDVARKVREAKGLIINTFLEFERHAIASLSADDKIPTVYPVGPILQDQGDDKHEGIIEWLGEQPHSSVVFLCFGSIGCFEEEQVKEIAMALENSGHRFLWSLRKPPPKGKMDFPGDYENPGEVLPKGFLERTAGIGKVIGWAPQMAALSHPAVGGFVSHCGWNSILESVWCGVPVAAWPLAVDQQANAFQLVKEFEMAVDIKMGYRKNCDMIVFKNEIEKAIRELMDMENGIRVKVKELKGKSRETLMEGGLSYGFLGRLIDDFMENI